ncbi:MAG: folA-2 [Nocardioidaceae bacterium]|nr:folA-2 [Nocardioidaceae bacterium]
MGEVVWGINCTLDGRCGHEDGIADEALHREAAESFAQCDTLLLGRITYELMFPYWATVAEDQSDTPEVNAFAVAMTEVPKVVFSRTLDQAGWNTRVVSSSPVDEVRRLRDEGARMNLGASPALAVQLREAGLIDRFHFVLHPVVAGRGPKLFGDNESIAMTLNSSALLPAGQMVLDYTVTHEDG